MVLVHEGDDKDELKQKHKEEGEFISENNGIGFPSPSSCEGDKEGDSNVDDGDGDNPLGWLMPHSLLSLIPFFGPRNQSSSESSVSTTLSPSRHRHSGDGNCNSSDNSMDSKSLSRSRRSLGDSCGSPETLNGMDVYYCDIDIDSENEGEIFGHATGVVVNNAATPAAVDTCQENQERNGGGHANHREEDDYTLNDTKIKAAKFSSNVDAKSAFWLVPLVVAVSGEDDGNYSSEKKKHGNDDDNNNNDDHDHSGHANNSEELSCTSSSSTLLGRDSPLANEPHANIDDGKNNRHHDRYYYYALDNARLRMIFVVITVLYLVLGLFFLGHDPVSAVVTQLQVVAPMDEAVISGGGGEEELQQQVLLNSKPFDTSTTTNMKRIDPFVHYSKIDAGYNNNNNKIATPTNVKSIRATNKQQTTNNNVSRHFEGKSTVTIEDSVADDSKLPLHVAGTTGVSSNGSELQDPDVASRGHHWRRLGRRLRNFWGRWISLWMLLGSMILGQTMGMHTISYFLDLIFLI